MSITRPTPDELAVRHIDQRLREIALHHDGLVDAVKAALDEHLAAGRIDRRKHSAARIFAMEQRDAVIREADRLLTIREKCVGGLPGIGMPGAAVMEKLARLRREKREHNAEQAKDAAWLDAEIEYGRDRDRAIHDGDILPNRSDYIDARVA